MQPHKILHKFNSSISNHGLNGRYTTTTTRQGISKPKVQIFDIQT